MPTKIVNIIGRQAMGVKRVSGLLSYRDTLDDGTESKMKGQKYYRYRANGKVFIVNENDEFNAQYDTKKLYSVNLVWDEDEDTYSFDYATTLQQEIDFKMGEVSLEAITVESVKVPTMSVLQAVAG